MDDPSLSRIQHTERERRTVLPNLVTGKPGHSLQFFFSRLAITFGVDDKAVIAIKLAAVNLKQQGLERIEQLAILSQCKMRVLAVKIHNAAFVSPRGGNLQIESEIGDQLG